MTFFKCNCTVEQRRRYTGGAIRGRQGPVQGLVLTQFTLEPLMAHKFLQVFEYSLKMYYTKYITVMFTDVVTVECVQ